MWPDVRPALVSGGGPRTKGSFAFEPVAKELGWKTAFAPEGNPEADKVTCSEPPEPATEVTVVVVADLKPAPTPWYCVSPLTIGKVALSSVTSREVSLKSFLPYPNPRPLLPGTANPESADVANDAYRPPRTGMSSATVTTATS